MGMNALTRYVIIKRLETYNIGLLPIATVGIISDRSKPVAMLPTSY